MYIRNHQSSAHLLNSHLFVDKQTFMNFIMKHSYYIAIAVVVIVIIIIIIICLYRRHMTTKYYNDNPELLTEKPEWGWYKKKILKNRVFEPVKNDNCIVIEKEENLSGERYKVQFKSADQSMIYFHRRMDQKAYFEVQIVQCPGFIQIGYAPTQKQNDKFLQKFKEGEVTIGAIGVCVNNQGLVQSEGVNVYNYNWDLLYGDVIGVGITKEGNNKLNERRSWITKNGVLLNRPAGDQMEKWIATAEISAEEKDQFQIGKGDTNQNQDKQKDGDNDKQQKKNDNSKEKKQQNELRKQKISLKMMKSFEYYPVISCYGNGEHESTKIYINVGGSFFRMHGEQFKEGLLS